LSYDHNKKAGNLGDVVKHVAQVAALDKILEVSPNEIFRYADIFAGYALNQLREGNEWQQGIGKLVGLEELRENAHVELWSILCLPARKADLVGWKYSGSSMIAYRMCKVWGKVAQLALWDTSQPVFADLKAAFGGHSHTLYQWPAKPDEEVIQKADFILIDPPGLDEWEFIRKFLKSSGKQPIIVWLPVNANATKKPPEEDKQSQKIRKEALDELGFHVTKVRWAKGGRTIGCQLIYRLPNQAERALRKAVQHVVEVAGWQNNLEVPVVVHYPEQLKEQSSDGGTCRSSGLY
jgi:23S rRNA A2030 N6-methylase RlmJ